MSGATLFGISAIGIVIVWMAWSLRDYKNPMDYFRSDDFKGILKGIVYAILIIGGTVLLTSCGGGSYFNDAHAYLGLEQTKNRSPMCEGTGPDSKATSNLGFKGNIYESEDERFRSNLKYTHHSCAFSPDDKSYDAIGIELEYKLWER